MRISLADANALSIADFRSRFADVAEHAPWVAAAASVARPFADRAAMIDAFGAVIDAAETSEQLALVQAHPDLAGRAALAGDLTPESRSEQRGAGLARLTADELERLTRLNTAYREKFGFPFILAVKGASLADIVAALGGRIGNEAEGEFKTALGQVKRIVRFRLEDRVGD